MSSNTENYFGVLSEAVYLEDQTLASSGLITSRAQRT